MLSSIDRRCHPGFFLSCACASCEPIHDQHVLIMYELKCICTLLSRSLDPARRARAIASQPSLTADWMPSIGGDIKCILGSSWQGCGTARA